MHATALGKVGGDVLPRLAVVGRLVDIRLAIIVSITCYGNIAGSVMVVRRFHARDASVLGQTRNGGHIVPFAAGIEAHHDAAVIAARPKNATLVGRFADGEERMRSTATLSASHRCTVGQIGTDCLRIATALRGHEKVLRATVKRLGIMRRKQHGRRPVPAVIRAARLDAAALSTATATLLLWRISFFRFVFFLVAFLGVVLFLIIFFLILSDVPESDGD